MYQNQFLNSSLVAFIRAAKFLVSYFHLFSYINHTCQYFLSPADIANTLFCALWLFGYGDYGNKGGKASQIF